MKYFEVAFTITPYSTDACDVVAALAGEAGFESFEETETGLLGYVQQALFEETTLKEAFEDFPFEGVSINYDVHEAEDKDWNEQWEQEGFEPIVVRGEWREVRDIIIHDGRHLPNNISDQDIAIEIDAKLAFGTGTHETTRMVVKQMGTVLFCLIALRVTCQTKKNRPHLFGNECSTAAPAPASYPSQP